MSPAEVDAWGARCRARLGDVMEGDAAHDLSHVRRVVAWARRLAQAEGADLAVVVPAAWLHDAVTVPKDSPDRARASALAARAAVDWLGREGYPADKLAAVAHAVEAHSFSAGLVARERSRRPWSRTPTGSTRSAPSGSRGSTRRPGRSARRSCTPRTRSRRSRRRARSTTAGGRPTTLFVKLLGLGATMRTQAGREEADRRIRTIRTFLDDLRREVSD